MRVYFLFLFASIAITPSVHSQDRGRDRAPPGGGQEVGGGDDAQDRYMHIWHQAIARLETLGDQFPQVSAAALRDHLRNGFRPFPVENLLPCDGLQRPVACYYPGHPPRVEFDLSRYNALSDAEQVRNSIHELLRSEGLDDDYALTDAILDVVPVSQFLEGPLLSCPTTSSYCVFRRPLRNRPITDLVLLRPGQGATVEVSGEYRVRGELTARRLPCGNMPCGASLVLLDAAGIHPIGWLLQPSYTVAPQIGQTVIQFWFHDALAGHPDYIESVDGEATIRIMNPDIEP